MASYSWFAETVCCDCNPRTKRTETVVWPRNGARGAGMRYVDRELARATVQMVRRWLLTAGPRVQYRVTSPEICGGPSDIWQVSLRVSSVSHANNESTIAPHSSVSVP